MNASHSTATETLEWALLLSSLSEVDGILVGDADHVTSEQCHFSQNLLAQDEHCLAAVMPAVGPPHSEAAGLQVEQRTSRSCSTSLMESTPLRCAPQQPSSCSPRGCRTAASMKSLA